MRILRRHFSQLGSGALSGNSQGSGPALSDMSPPAAWAGPQEPAPRHSQGLPLLWGGVQFWTLRPLTQAQQLLRHHPPTQRRNCSGTHTHGMLAQAHTHTCARMCIQVFACYTCAGALEAPKQGSWQRARPRCTVPGPLQASHGAGMARLLLGRVLPVAHGVQVAFGVPMGAKCLAP